MKKTQLSKKELAQILGISKRKLAYDLNIKFFKRLFKFGYKKDMRILPEQIIKYFIKDWSIETSKKYFDSFLQEIKQPE